MCSEFILAFLYFSLLLFFNYFLIKIVIKDIFTILQKQKTKQIFVNFNKLKIINIYLLFKIGIKTNFNNSILNQKNILNQKDLLILSSTYQYFDTQFDSFEKFNNYYFKLLKTHYFSLSQKKIN